MGPAPARTTLLSTVESTSWSGPVARRARYSSLTTAGSAEGTRATHIDATTNARTSAAAHNGKTARHRPPHEEAHQDRNAHGQDLRTPHGCRAPQPARLRPVSFGPHRLPRLPVQSPGTRLPMFSTDGVRCAKRLRPYRHVGTLRCPRSATTRAPQDRSLTGPRTLRQGPKAPIPRLATQRHSAQLGYPSGGRPVSRTCR